MPKTWIHTNAGEIADALRDMLGLPNGDDEGFPLVGAVHSGDGGLVVELMECVVETRRPLVLGHLAAQVDLGHAIPISVMWMMGGSLLWKSGLNCWAPNGRGPCVLTGGDDAGSFIRVGSTGVEQVHGHPAPLEASLRHGVERARLRLVAGLASGRHLPIAA